MRHNKKFNHLGRTSSHRKALLSNMTVSLITYKRITTTVAKAKALRIYAEPIINRAKEDSTNNRRLVFAKLQDKEAVKILFGEIAEKIATRPGGYLRILKLGNRLGDNASTAMVEFVDYNDNMAKEEKKTKTRRSRAKKSADAPAAEAASETKPEAVAEAPAETAAETPAAE
jgi:large subunit ribosomal protein L17